MGAIADVFGARQAELDAVDRPAARRHDRPPRPDHDRADAARRMRAWPSCRSGWRSSTPRKATSSRSPARSCSCRRSCPTSRRAAPSASRAWRRSSPTACRTGAYEFQATLSNGSRPDCVIQHAERRAVAGRSTPSSRWKPGTPSAPPTAPSDAQKLAAQAFRRDIEIHIRDIAEKYLIPGETQDTAFMFVPSESVFAEIHENFEAVVQQGAPGARRHRLAVAADAVDPGRAGDPARMRACASRRI